MRTMSNLIKACTLMPSPNETYLANTAYKGQEPSMDGGSLGLMMLLSTFQLTSPTMNPAYSNAANQAGKAAYIQSGGQAKQDRFLTMAERNARDTAHQVGITDTEMTVVLTTAKVVKDRKVDLKGPSLYDVKTSLTADPSSATLGFKYEW